MTPARIEPATFRFVVQYLNHCAIATPKCGSIMVHQLLGDYRERREGQTIQNWEEEGKNVKALKQNIVQSKHNNIQVDRHIHG